jgi:hypothetical protein
MANSPEDKDEKGRSRMPRSPLLGWMKGTVTIAPGTDLTEPACPEWADIAEESCEQLARMIEEGRRNKKA